MKREPYIPGALAPLDPPRCLREPVILFDEEALIAACRRVSAIADRWAAGIAATGLAWIAAGCLL
jgi:hypothetical protein